jgi:hypothetical protein
VKKLSWSWSKVRRRMVAVCFASSVVGFGGVCAPTGLVAQLPLEVKALDGAGEALALTRVVAVEYSRVAWLARVRGTFELDVRILPDGSVAEIKVAKGLPSLEEPARAAAAGWRFAPQPAERWGRAAIEFLASAAPTDAERGSPQGARRWLYRVQSLGEFPWSPDNCRAFEEFELASRDFPAGAELRRTLFAELAASPATPVAFIAGLRQAEVVDGITADEVRRRLSSSDIACARCAVPRELERREAGASRTASARELKAFSRALSEANFAGTATEAQVGTGWARATVEGATGQKWGEAYFLSAGDGWRLTCPPFVSFLR